MSSLLVFLNFLVIIIIFALVYSIKKNRNSILEIKGNYEKLKKSHFKLTIVEKELETQYNKLQEKDKKIEYLAFYDDLTNLPNKLSLIEKLKKITNFEEKISFSLIFIDIDNFKNINDIFGYDYGDKILIIIGNILKNTLNENSSLFRWCGNEFVILVENCNHQCQSSKIAENIIFIFNNGFNIDQKKVYLTASIGISTYPNDSNNIDDIIKNSEIAMYKSKSTGKNKYCFYDKKILDSLYRKTLIEKHLRDAIHNNELYIKYQPQYDVITENIVGYEALLRWNSKELGEVSPSEFIPVAEESDLIPEIGNWVLKNSCLQNKKWINNGISHVIAVNISAIQFEQKNFVEIVKNILNETNLEAKFLELEITETTLIKSFEKSIEIIEVLRELGIKVSLDDFGTGYSSLSYLKKLPINNLKIDKSFIDDINISDNSKSILQCIVQLAHMINLKVIAEGIETANQSKILKNIDCDFAQGFFFSKPITTKEIEKILFK